LYRQYDVTVNTVFLEKHSKYVVLTQPSREFEGSRVMTQVVNGGLVYFYVDAPDGIHRIATRRTEGTQTVTDKTDRLVLPHPLRLGESWKQETMTGVLETVVDPFRRIYRLEIPVMMRYTVESLSDRVRVPAGTFDDCLRIRGVGNAAHKGDAAIRKAAVSVEQIDWYAPGVGLVKSYRRETTTNKNLRQGEFRLELEVVNRH
jgi:hypothetical protein